MVHRNASLVIFTAQQTPDIALELLEVKKLGDGLHRIRIRASNAGAIPTISGRSVRYNIVRKDILSVGGGGIEVVSGGIVEDLELDNVRYIEHHPSMIFTSVPSFGKRDLQWIVKGKGKVEVRFDSMKAANRTLTVEL